MAGPLERGGSSGTQISEPQTSSPSPTLGRHRSKGELLVSDRARERAARGLSRAYTKGRLSADELEERVEAVWAARTRADLGAVTRDLPRRRRRSPSPWLAPVWPIVLLARRVRRGRRRR